MRSEEGTYLAHRQGNPLLGLFPGEHAHFGLRSEHRGLHGDGVWMRRDIIGQDQYRRLAITHEIACDGKNEVGVGAVHAGQKFVDHLDRDVGPAACQRRAPGLHIAFVEKVAHLRARPARLREHGRNDTIGRSPQKVPDEGAANAEAQHHELVDA